jgi:hypothetical protein
MEKKKEKKNSNRALIYGIIACLVIIAIALFALKCNNKPGDEEEKDKRKNLVDTMTDSDLKALNIFFSNFSETHFGDFTNKSYDTRALIDFGLQHNVINNRSRLIDDVSSEHSYMDKEYMDITVKKYFDIEGITHQSGKPTGFVVYDNGKYFWHDVFEGSPWFEGSQLIELYDNGDGTFSAITEDYQDSPEFNDKMEEFLSSFYEPKRNWKPEMHKLVEANGYHAARIAPHEFNGKQTYKLLEWHITDTKEEAHAIMKRLDETGQASANSDVEILAGRAMDYIAKDDYVALADMANPEKGIKFVPYVNTQSNDQEGMRLSVDELKEAATSDKKYPWGNYDGTGEPINVSLKEYVTQFIYDKDYKNAPNVGSFTEKTKETVSLDIDEEFFAMYYSFPGSEEFTGMDWSTLYLVFRQDNGKWYLTDIMHEQWTV